MSPSDRSDRPGTSPTKIARDGPIDILRGWDNILRGWDNAAPPHAGAFSQERRERRCASALRKPVGVGEQMPISSTHSDSRLRQSIGTVSGHAERLLHAVMAKLAAGMTLENGSSH